MKDKPKSTGSLTCGRQGQEQTNEVGPLSSADTDSLTAGKLLADRFKLMKRVGSTNSLTEWTASDTTLDRTVRVYLSDGEHSAGCADAARLVAAHSDSRLPRTLDIGTVDDTETVYIVQELFEGQLVDDVLTRGALHPTVARSIVGDIAFCLHRASVAGLHHQTLTARNITQTNDGDLRLTGLSIEAAAAGIAADGDKADQSDVVSLANLMYHCLTGQLWDGQEESANPRSVASSVPKDLDALCRKILLDTDDNTIKTPGDLAKALVPWNRIPRRISPGKPTDGTVASSSLAAATNFGYTAPRRPSPHRSSKPGSRQSSPTTGAVTKAKAPNRIKTYSPGELGSLDNPIQPRRPNTTRTGRVVAPPTLADVWRYDNPNIEQPLAQARRTRFIGAGKSAKAKPAWPPRIENDAPQTPFSETVCAQEFAVPARSRRSSHHGIRLIAICAVLLAVAFTAAAIKLNLGQSKVRAPQAVPTTPVFLPNTATQSPDATNSEPSVDESNTPTSTAEPTQSATDSTPATLSKVVPLDPEGDNKENNDRAALALDDDSATTWRSNSYGDAKFATLKSGLGLEVTWTPGETVNGLVFHEIGQGGKIEIREAPAGDIVGTTLKSVTATGQSQEITFDQPVTSGRLVIWYSELPQNNGKFRAEVATLKAR